MSGPARVVWWVILHPVRTFKLAVTCAAILTLAAMAYNAVPHPAAHHYPSMTTTPVHRARNW